MSTQSPASRDLEPSQTVKKGLVLTANDEKLLQRSEDVDTQSIDRLSDAGQRLVEWSTGAISLFFAAIALVENPQILSAFQQATPKILGSLAILFYLVAVACGFFASIPHRYRINKQNLTSTEARLRKVFKDKYRLIVVGSCAFALASVALGGLIMGTLWVF